MWSKPCVDWFFLSSSGITMSGKQEKDGSNTILWITTDRHNHEFVSFPECIQIFIFHRVVWQWGPLWIVGVGWWKYISFWLFVLESSVAHIILKSELFFPSSVSLHYSWTFRFSSYLLFIHFLFKKYKGINQNGKSKGEDCMLHVCKKITRLLSAG